MFLLFFLTNPTQRNIIHGRAREPEAEEEEAPGKEKKKTISCSAPIMEVEAPKRMTRARAAKAGAEPTTKTTKIVTAATKARTTATATATSTATLSTRSTSAKRKTRADENEDDEGDYDDADAVPTTARGRAKKANQTSTTAPARATRGRPAKKIATEAAREQAAPKLTRGRPKKATEPEADMEEKKTEPVKKATRGRPTAASRSTASSRAAATTKPTVKKSVTFEEPDKENTEPLSKAKEAPAPGIRGRPARRGGAACARGTRTASTTVATKAAETKLAEKKPLSPKKVTQMPFSRVDDSEDELAGEHTPVKPMQKSPVKPPVKKQAEAEPPVDEDDTIKVNNAILNPPDLGSASTLASPARRPPVSPFKEIMKTPAKKLGAVPLPASAMQSTAKPGLTAPSPSKNTMLQSAAKRPPSPIKGLQLGSAQKTQQPLSAMKVPLLQSPPKRSVPSLKPVLESNQKDGAEPPPTMKSLLTAAATPAMRPSQRMMMEDTPDESGQEDMGDDVFDAPMSSLQFPGRLSAVLPRHADPALNPSPKETSPEAGPEEATEGVVESAEEQEEEEEKEQEDAEEEAGISTDAVPEPEEVQEENAVEDVMDVDEVAADIEVTQNLRASETSTPNSPAQDANPMFQLREKDQGPCANDSESDDEPSPMKPAYSTPVTRSTRRSTLGLTSLADQLGAWTAHSPAKSTRKAASKRKSKNAKQASEEAEVAPQEPSALAASTHFFEDEMVAHTDEDEPKPQVDDEMFDEAVINEDLALAQEANEMSLMEPEQVTEAEETHRSFDSTLSDASQEYGDENQMPIDPALLGHPAPPVTPARPLQKSFHTTTKVPLKPADDSTPSPMKKRSFSASRLGPKRPNGSMRSASVISYSPVKDSSALDPVTPSKNDLWSSMGTPARTPRRDLNPGLLRGAVVFVDVHTSEGADASHIFIELLNSMGARCIKNWTWNPDSEFNAESSGSSKIGITHVVYKDGGKRTMEKVRRTNGVVHCVGVSWVLE